MLELANDETLPETSTSVVAQPQNASRPVSRTTVASIAKAFQSAGNAEPVPREGRTTKVQSAVAARMQARFNPRRKENACTDETADSAAAVLRKRVLVPKPARRKWRLADVSERRVLNCGIRRLYEFLVEKPGIQVKEMPLRADGRPKVLKANFFKLLFMERLEFNACLEGDISGAQSDIRHLSLEQLLALRSRTLLFVTESTKHSAHNSFLCTVDLHLYEKLCWRLTRGLLVSDIAERSQASWEGQIVESDAVRALGLQFALMLGVAEFLRDGWGVPAQAELADMPAVPDLWLIKLPEGFWHGAQVALIDTRNCTLQVLPGEAPDIAGASAEKLVAVVTDRTAGCSKDRQLNWEIAPVDPKFENVMMEVTRAERGCASRNSRCVSEELVQIISKRRTGEPQEVGTSPKESSEGPYTPSPKPARQSHSASIGKVARYVQSLNTPPQERTNRFDFRSGGESPEKTAMPRKKGVDPFGNSMTYRGSSAPRVVSGGFFEKNRPNSCNDADNQLPKAESSPTAVDEGPPLGGAEKVGMLEDTSACAAADAEATTR
eukprot:TRINITY_DN17183_c0_g5_i1.p1 TRINITY_DN17183_c0_g5~~TRINITY_DN17183_c0_g5_i1.p1  ORF type:complete len:577 (-),score=80.59 TRINITY_DN17183_c0_g5_i1:182-1834(-)